MANSKDGQPPAIVTDSNVSLPLEVVRSLPLFIVPLEIHHGGRVYRDGVDLSPSQFYELQARSPELPKTSAPNPGAFLDAYRRAAELSNQILCITLSTALSSTHDAAVVAQHKAREALPHTTITVIDSCSAGIAQGFIALAAARKAAADAGRDEVLELVRRRIGDVCLYGYLESLYYVWRGGRVPRVLMWMGKLLSVKPILQLYQGQVGMVERPRTAQRAIGRLVALASERLNGAPGCVAVMHATAPNRAYELAERLERELQPVELLVTEFTPVIGAHTGPGVVGCALYPVDR